MNNRLITVYPGFYLITACAFMLVPIKWFLAWLIAVAVHELCHIIALMCLHVKILNIRIRWNGTWIQTEPMPGYKTVISALAGPVGSAALLLLLPAMPRTAFCAGFQAAYNLLPMFPTDGGRVLHGVLAHYFGEKIARRVCDYSKLLSVVFILVFLSVIGLKTGGFVLTLLPMLLILCKYKKFLAIGECSEYNSLN